MLLSVALVCSVISELFDCAPVFVSVIMFVLLSVAFVCSVISELFDCVPVISIISEFTDNSRLFKILFNFFFCQF